MLSDDGCCDEGEVVVLVHDSSGVGDAVEHEISGMNVIMGGGSGVCVLLNKSEDGVVPVAVGGVCGGEWEVVVDSIEPWLVGGGIVGFEGYFGAHRVCCWVGFEPCSVVGVFNLMPCAVDEHEVGVVCSVDGGAASDDGVSLADLVVGDVFAVWEQSFGLFLHHGFGEPFKLGVVA